MNSFNLRMIRFLIVTNPQAVKVFYPKRNVQEPQKIIWILKMHLELIVFQLRFIKLLGRISICFDAFYLCLCQGTLSVSQRREIIKLTPKKDADPHFIKKWRPLTLLNPFPAEGFPTREIKLRVYGQGQTANGRLLLVVKARKLSYSSLFLCF